MDITQPAEPVLRRALVVPLDSIEWRDSGDPNRKNETTLRGHAAVFNRTSEDLGGFREIIEAGAFRDALRKQPDVRLLFNHDSNYVMGRTASGTLDLREDATGLHVFARVDRDITWIEDLRRSMQRGDIDQMSFAFTLREGGVDVTLGDDGVPLYTIRQDGIDRLFDVSVVTYPAYPQTDASVRSALDASIPTDHRLNSGVTDDIASDEQTGAVSESRTGAGSDDQQRRARLAGLRAKSRGLVHAHRNLKGELS